MSDPPEMSGLRVGEVLVGKYRVERVLGAGGMGVVVAAHHLQLDEMVALKFLLPAAMRDPQIVARFEREARASAKLKSEHVVRVSDVGFLESGAPYMVMEYLEGRDLSTWLVQEGRLPVDLAVEFVLQACEALAEAHSIGIVHRDVKPANLFCARRPSGQPSIKVLDFGISRLVSSEASRQELTRTSNLLGTPLYMSPEHMRSARNVDHRSDIWALGVILYELLTGATPFDADAVTEVAIKVATLPAPWLNDIRVDAPPGLALVIVKCLEKDPDKRFQTVGELATALAAFAPQGARSSIDRTVATLRRSLGPGVITGPGVEPLSAPALSSTAPDAPTQIDARPLSATARRSRAAFRWSLTLLPLAVVAMLARYVVHANTPNARTVLSDAAVVVAPPSSASAAASASPPPSSSAAPVPSDPVPTAPPTSSSSRVAPPRPKSGSHTPSAPKAPSNAQPDCDPPFTIDAKGTHVFKKECL